jgi:hypothetical protein
VIPTDAGRRKPRRGNMVGADRDAGKCARARAVAAEEKAMQAEYAERRRGLAPKDRFRQTGASDVVRLCESHANEKGETLSQFEDRRPATGQRRSCGLTRWSWGGSSPKTAQQRSHSASKIKWCGRRPVQGTIKRWVSDPVHTFPKPIQLCPEGVGWPADQMRHGAGPLTACGQVGSTEQPSVGSLGNLNRLIEFL